MSRKRKYLQRGRKKKGYFAKVGVSLRGRCSWLQGRGRGEEKVEKGIKVWKVEKSLNREEEA